LVKSLHILFNVLNTAVPTPIETNDTNIETFLLKTTVLVDFLKKEQNTVI